MSAISERERLIQGAIDSIQAALERGLLDEEKRIAPRDHITTLKAIHALEIDLLEAREAREAQATQALEIQDAGRQIQELSARLEDLQAENAELKATIKQLRETQRAWANAGM